MITLIASVTKNNGIGYKGNLICESKEDINFFKKVTSGSTVVMGRKTFESIGKPLSCRKNIVISKNASNHLRSNILNTYKDRIYLHNSVGSVIREILSLARESSFQNIYVIGGASIYEQFLPFANKMILTRVDTVVVADTFFPEVDYSEWELEEQEELNSNSIVYTYFRKEKYNQDLLEVPNVVKLLYDVPLYGLVEGQVGTIVEDYTNGDFMIEFADPDDASRLITLNETYLKLYRRG